MEQSRIIEFANMIKNSPRTVFFGGAGVSTESGVKDYRSEDGLYNTVKEYGVSPEVILSHSFFYEHTDVFYDFYYKYFLDAHPSPNAAHTALARLEEMGLLDAVITQNIDGLHQAAGSRRVYELHGTTAKNRCSRCLREFPTEKIAALHGAIPHCPECGSVIKPEVTLYEESLNETTVDCAVAAIDAADLLIIGGTSLAVYPAAAYLRYFRGSNIVLINREPTPYDSKASLVFREPIGKVLEQTMKAL